MKFRILVFALLLFGVLGGIFYFKGASIITRPSMSIKPEVTRPKEDSNKIQAGSFTYLSTDLNRKKELIVSNNIDNVMTAIKMGHVSDNGSMDYRSFSSINIKAFRVDLNIDDRYNKLNNFLNISEFPNSEDATLTNNSWKGFSYSEASDMYTKDGYACILLRPNRFKTTPYISCSNALVLSQNTLKMVGDFMLKFLSSAGVSCKSESCEITETQEEYPLDKYGRELIYFDKGISRTNDSELIKEVNMEAKESAKFLESSGWKVNLQDYTKTEQTWDKSALISMRVDAENGLFTCSHKITVTDLGKRQIISCAYRNDLLGEVQKFYNPYK